MPNQPATKHSSFRLPADLKEAAAAKARGEGRDLTAVIVEKLTEYVTPPPPAGGRATAHR